MAHLREMTAEMRECIAACLNCHGLCLETATQLLDDWRGTRHSAAPKASRRLCSGVSDKRGFYAPPFALPSTVLRRVR